MDPALPWCLVGCGPSMRDPNKAKKEFNLLALNRAIGAVHHAEVWAFCHRTVWEDARRYRNRADKIVTGEPMCWDPELKSVFEHEELTRLFHAGKLEVRRRVNRDNVKPWELFEHYPHNNTVACFALGWLRDRGVTDFFSYGVCDDPKARHPSFKRKKTSRPEWHKPHYFDAYRSFLATIESLGMNWTPLAEEPMFRCLEDLEALYCLV